MSSIFKDKEEEKFKPEYSVYGLSMGGEMPTVEQLTTALGDDANLSGIVSTEGGGYVTLLSQQEQSAYDRAVKMGNGVAARHYAIINASRVKRLLDKGIKGLNDGEIEKLGLKEPKPIVPVEKPVIVSEDGGSSGDGGSSYNPMVFDDNDETYTPTSAQLNADLEAAGQTNLTSDTSEVDFTQTSTGGDFVETGEDDSDPFEDISASTPPTVNDETI